MQDAVNTGDPDAQQEFSSHLQPVSIDFRRFQDLSEQAVASDQRHRQVIQRRTQTTQQTSELVLLIATFGTISLVFLFAAYLAANLFTPLKEAKHALDDLAHGDWNRQLAEERNDEFGAVNQAFNRMAVAIQEREQILSVANAVDAPISTFNWEEMPSRVTLHRLVSELRSRVMQLSQANERNAGEQKVLIFQLDQLLQVIARITDFGFSLDLNLARTDIRGLLYEVLLRFHSINGYADVGLKLTQAIVE